MGARNCQRRSDDQYYNLEANNFLSWRVSSAASANSQSRNVTIFDFIATALGQAIQYVLDSFKDRSDRSRDHENF